MRKKETSDIKIGKLEQFNKICQKSNCDDYVRICFTKAGLLRRQKYCSKHYGESVRNFYIKRYGMRWVDGNGYIQVRQSSGGAVAEHRIVMEEKLKRKLTNFESVHHINGIRHDNSPDNLELWVGGIRPGQRASDVVCPHCHKPYVEKKSNE